MKSDALRVIETAVLERLRELDLTLLELDVSAGPEDLAHEILRRHWTRWQLEEPEVVRLMGLWGLIDLVASMVDDVRDAEAAAGQVGGIGPAPRGRALSERRARVEA
jgi:hypothetical protein